MSNRFAEGSFDHVEPLIDLQRIVSGIRWRRRTCLVLALVGLLLGMAPAAVVPTRASASARIYVVHEDGGSGDSEAAMTTDLALLETTTVAAVALDRLQTDMSPERFVAEFSGDVVAGNVLEISARGADDAQALARTQAVADAFIAVHLKRTDDGAAAEEKALTDRQAQVQRDLADVNDQIARASNGTPDQATTTALYERRSSLSAQIIDLGQRAETAGIGSPKVAAGTKIIDAAHVTSRSLIVSVALGGAVGMLLGLAVGLVAAVIATIARDRPVLRRDISANLGASVIAQLPAPLRLPKRLWKRSRRDEARRRLAVTIARLVRDGNGPVSLLELGCPDVVANLAKDVVAELAGGNAIVVDDLPGRELRSKAADGSAEVIDGSDFSPIPSGEITAGRMRLAVASVGPGTPWTDLRRLGDEAVLVVRAGSSETTWMHTVARQLADAGIAIIGLVVVHPDPRDRSDGTLWNALHTAMRGRGLSIPSPQSAAQPAPLAEVPTAPRAPLMPPPIAHESPTVAFTAVLPAVNGAAVNGVAVNGAAVNGDSPADNNARRCPSPRSTATGSQPDACPDTHPRPRPRPRSATDIDGHPTDKITPVQKSPVERQEAT